MDFLDPKLESFIEKFTKPETTVLQELNRETNAKVLNPRMLAGHLQGRVISMISHMIKPKNVLEIGTYTGYSAICWCEGLADNGKVYTIDVNEELEDMARSYFEKAGVTEKIEYLIGNALDLIPKINQEFDVVYIDADKENYLNYYELIFDKVKPGGYIIADNVLWNGKVTEPEDQMDENTRAIVAYCKRVVEDNRVENVVFPIRDGLMVARKL